MWDWRWGNVPLPEPHLGGLAVGLLMHARVSRPLFAVPWLGHVAGWPLVLAGLSLAVWAVRAATNVDMAKAGRIIVQGPYAICRNPMYVGWTLMYLGITLAVNTAWLLAALPVVLLWTHIVVIREERHLVGRFGAEYRLYLRSVRRYL